MTLAATIFSQAMLSTRKEIEAVIARRFKTSGVNGEPLGCYLPLAPGKIDLGSSPLPIYPGTLITGCGTSTVLKGNLVIETDTSPDNYAANAITIERLQWHGWLNRGKTATNEMDDITLNDVKFFSGGGIDLTGHAVNRLELNRVEFHAWRGTTVSVGARNGRFIACKWLSEDVDVNTYPLIDLIGDQCTARFESCWLQPRGMGIKAIGGGVSITLENNHIEPLRPKSEAAQQRSVLPRMEFGTGTVIADRLDAMDVQPIILRGTTLRCADQRAINQWGGAIPLEQGFIGLAA